MNFNNKAIKADVRRKDKPLFGIPLNYGRNGAVYVGEIVIRSYTKKLNAGFNLDVPDIKEVTIRNNTNDAKVFLGKIGADPTKIEH